MKIQCPGCGMQLKAGGKLVEKVSSLKKGEVFRVRCTQCSEPITVSGDLLGEDNQKVKPPVPPDTSWLKAGDEDGGAGEGAEELPTVLLLMEETMRRESIAASFVSLGYRVELAETSRDGIEKMQFFNYAAVVQEDAYEPGPLSATKIHKHISGMDMAKRRQMLYILIGDDFRTMYDLEALCFSANLVVNTGDINHFPVLLRKVVRENEILFGPLIAEMQALGR